MTYDSVDMSIRNHAHEEGAEVEREMALDMEVEELYEAAVENPELSDGILSDAFVEFEEGSMVDEDYLLRILQAEDDDELLEVAREMKDGLEEVLRNTIRKHVEG